MVEEDQWSNYRELPLCKLSTCNSLSQGAGEMVDWVGEKKLGSKSRKGPNYNTIKPLKKYSVSNLVSPQ